MKRREKEISSLFYIYKQRAYLQVTTVSRGQDGSVLDIVWHQLVFFLLQAFLCSMFQIVLFSQRAVLVLPVQRTQNFVSFQSAFCEHEKWCGLDMSVMYRKCVCRRQKQQRDARHASVSALRSVPQRLLSKWTAAHCVVFGKQTSGQWTTQVASWQPGVQLLDTLQIYYNTVQPSFLFLAKPRHCSVQS